MAGASRTLLLQAAFWAAMFGTAPVQAASPELVEPAMEQLSAATSFNADAEPARIIVGRSADGAGRPMFGWRRDFAESAAMVSFSTRQPRHKADTDSAPAVPRIPLALGNGGQLPRFFPLAARAVTSTFGMRRHPLLGIERAHEGVDLAAVYGTPIAATADGTVAFANWDGGYGLLVAVDHERGIQTRYGHMSRLGVALGQHVHAGDIIGYVGSTGLSTGPHVHYEVRVNGQAIDPYTRGDRR